jgi:hypothetical protein
MMLMMLMMKEKKTIIMVDDEKEKRSIMNRYVTTSLMYGQGKTNKRWPRGAKDAARRK